MTTSNPKLIELPVRFSQSKIWEIQRNYFKSMGIDAWKEEVPFYITSNTFTAKRYAMLALHFIQDWLNQHPQDKNKTFYFFELGCGTGKFSFYFLTQFKALLKSVELGDLKYCYIISDMVKANVEFCKTNPSLAPFIQEGVVDFAVFDLVNDKDFHLDIKNTNFSAIQSETPLMVIANYIFGCVEMDLLQFENGVIKEVKLGLQSRYDNFNLAESKHLDDLRLEYDSSSNAPKPYSPDQVLNNIIEDYESTFKDKNFYLPIPSGAIKFIQTLSELTHDRFLMIGGDKAVSQEAGIPLVQLNYITSYDGCYAFMMNFDALGKYLKRTGGDCLLTKSWQDFKVNLFTKGISLDKCKNTTGFFENILESMGPSEYCALYKEYLTNSYRFSYSALSAFLKISECDPDAYGQVHGDLINIMTTLSPVKKQEIDDLLKKVQQNIYSLTIGTDISNLMGIYYYLNNQDLEAITLFERSIDIYGDKSFSYHNLGLLYERKKDKEQAILYFKKAVELDPKDSLAKQKYQKLSKTLGWYAIKPLVKLAFLAGLLFVAMYFLKL